MFPKHREILADAVEGVRVKLKETELRRAWVFGNYWLGCELWEGLGLSGFWRGRLAKGREEVAWAKVLQLLAVSRLVSPGTKFGLHRQGYS